MSYNSKEVGRTSVIPQSLNPDWGKWKMNSVMVDGILGKGGVGEVVGGGGMFTIEVYDMDMGVKMGAFLGETQVGGMIACDEEAGIVKEEDDLKAKKGAKFSNMVGGSVVFSVKSQWQRSRDKEAPLTFKCTGANGKDTEPGQGPKGSMVANAKDKMGEMPSIGMPSTSANVVPSVFKDKTVMVEPHFKLKLTLHRCKGLAKAGM